MLEVSIEGRPVVVASYYAPPGVSWGRVKVDQAVSFTDWLCRREGPVIVGADANTPKLDPVDDTAVQTHWYTGFRKLNGDPGDDVLWGSSPRHQLKDCLRTWLAMDPRGCAGSIPRARSRSRTTRRSGRTIRDTRAGSTRSGRRPMSKCSTCGTCPKRSAGSRITHPWWPSCGWATLGM